MRKSFPPQTQRSMNSGSIWIKNVEKNRQFQASSKLLQDLSNWNAYLCVMPQIYALSINDLAAFQIKFCARCTHHLLHRTLLLCTCIFYPQQSSSSLGSYTLTYYFLRILKMKRKRGEKVFLSRESSVDKQRDMTISGK